MGTVRLWQGQSMAPARLTAMGGRATVVPTILTSIDGLNWVQRQPGTTDLLGAISYGNGLFVAVGDSGTILTSAEGVTWAQRQSGPTAFLVGIAYGNGQFVAAT